MRRVSLNLEKYRRRQEEIAMRLLEIAGRNPFDLVVTRQISRINIQPIRAKKCRLTERLKRNP